MTNPRGRFALPLGNEFSVWDLRAADRIEPDRFRSKGRATPFAGWDICAKNLLTGYHGSAVYITEA